MIIGVVVALVALSVHGALYLALKATGELEARVDNFARRSWIVLCAVTLLSLAATVWVRPTTLVNYENHWALFAIPLAVLATLAGMRIYVCFR